MDQAIEVGVYKHYKGKFYSVIGIVRHSETEELMVLYMPLYVAPQTTGCPTQMTVRPVQLFNEKFTKVLDSEYVDAEYF